MRPPPVLLFACTASLVLADSKATRGDDDRTMTKVIKMLQGMLEKSKEDGENDQTLFAKYKCYCDSNTDSKKKSIESLGKQIELLDSDIDKLSAEIGKLSSESASLDMQIGDNERARETAQSLRDKANEDFVADESDMKSAIDQMDQAIETLSGIGADQTALASLKGAMTKIPASRLSSASMLALKAAAVFLPPQQRQKVGNFLQAPFTGDYKAQSGEIVGILKNMRDTFKSNLASAIASESASADSHSKFMEVKNAEHAKMKKLFEEKDSLMGESDESKASKKKSLEAAKESKADDEEFLGKLVNMCEAKQKQYDQRKMVRANEEAAIAKAVSILNSDEAFATFGAAKATSSGSTGPALLQLRVRKSVSVRDHLVTKLTRQAKRQKSLKLARAAVFLEKGQPFDVVTKELDAMIAIIDKEQAADDEQKAWCDGERETSHSLLEEKETSKSDLEGTMTKITDDIEHVETGLKKQLADENAALAQNRQDQKDEKEDRQLENAAYQKNVINLDKARITTQAAIDVLKAFYDWLHKKQGPHHYEQYDGQDSGSGNMKRMPEATIDQLEEACSADPECLGFNSNGYLKNEIDPEEKWYDSDGSLYVKVYDSESPVLAQVGAHKPKHVNHWLKSLAAVKVHEDPAPPEAWGSGESDGGSQSSKATDVVSMLQFIKEETQKEENAAHDDEVEAQHQFEDTINALLDDEKNLQNAIAELEEQLAEREKALAETKKDHEKVSLEVQAVQTYLKKIKPGCDWMNDNIGPRSEGRNSEKKGLQTAKEELMSTPIYKEAKAAEEKEALGECADECIEDLNTAICGACQEKVSVVGYCATHPDTPGCEETAAGASM